MSGRKDAELNAFVRITASTSLPVHEQATALRAYLNPTTGLGHIVPLWFVELTGFTYTQELETLLGDAAQWYEARFAMPQTRCHPVDFRPWNRHVGLPDLARIELVGSEPGKPWSVSMMAVMWLTRFAREIQLQACELQCDMNDVKEVSTWVSVIACAYVRHANCNKCLAPSAELLCHARMSSVRHVTHAVFAPSCCVHALHMYACAGTQDHHASATDPSHIPP